MPELPDPRPIDRRYGHSYADRMRLRISAAEDEAVALRERVVQLEAIVGAILGRMGLGDDLIEAWRSEADKIDLLQKRGPNFWAVVNAIPTARASRKPPPQVVPDPAAPRRTPPAAAVNAARGGGGS
jgi:hypothetical protein